MSANDSMPPARKGPRRTSDWSSIIEPESVEPDRALPPNERTVIAYPLDLSVKTIVDDVSGENARIYLDLFQRAFVWNRFKSSRLIESLVLNVPLPVIYLSEDQDNRLSIIDGNQRITSLHRFLTNQFPLSSLELTPELNGQRYHQLPKAVQNHIATRALRCVVIDKRSHPRVKFDMFERLNTQATPLNAQELRNCLQRGRFNELIHSLCTYPPWLELFERSTPDRRMRDAELLLRLFALVERLDTYERPLRDFMTEYMEDNKSAGPAWLASKEVLLKTTVDSWIALLGAGTAFHRLDRDGTPEGRFVAAIFDAQMVSLARIGGTTRRSPESVREFTIEATDPRSAFMQDVVTGSSHAEALRNRVAHYQAFLAGR